MSQALSASERQRLVSRAGIITISTNVTLTAFRVLAGVLSGSTAMIADAANSGTDIFATLVVMGGARVAAQPPDPGHPYGHEKAEPVAAKIVGLIVTAAGVVTAMGSLQALHAGGAEVVGAIALWVAGGSILAKELLARYLTAVARRTDNEALMADGANQRTDVLASSAALVGALGARLGYPVLDPAMGLLVAGLILRMGLGLYWRSVTRLMDPAPKPETMADLTYAVATVDGVLSVDEVKARIFGSGIYVDCKICVDEDLTVAEGHRIAHRVKEAMREAVDDVRDVLVHVNPCPAPRSLDGAVRRPEAGEAVGAAVWAGGEAEPGDGEKHV